MKLLRLALDRLRKVRTRRGPSLQRTLCCEHLEDRRLLAIVWSNETTANFSTFGGNEVVARQIVNRAIDNWEAVITDFNYDGDHNSLTGNNTFNLSVIVGDLGPGSRGQTSVTFVNGLPTESSITLDDNGGGYNWYFDKTPLDDAEFTAIVNSDSAVGTSFQGSFVDITGGLADLYRTIVHEIGHAMGLASSSPVFATSNPLMTYIGTDPLLGGGNLYTFHNAAGSYGVTATITTNGGRHLYEISHPNDLMNPGRITPVGSPMETTRQFISDLDVQLLADAYGYSVVLPSTFESAHVTLDSQTGTLLVQGGVTAQGASQNDRIIIDTVGSDIRVRVNNSSNVTYASETVTASKVSQIVVCAAGDAIAPSYTGITVPVQTVYWVVSSNQDALDPGTLGNVFVDLDTVVPGAQVSLRAAIQDATAPPVQAAGFTCHAANID